MIFINGLYMVGDELRCEVLGLLDGYFA